jgi:hypothetical protein
MQVERHQTIQASDQDIPLRPEPMPKDNVIYWKHWLKDTRDHPRSKGKFKYPGIPLIGPGYQTAHIEGTKAILLFIPCKPSGGYVCGPLRDTFSHTTAALLSMPECYQEMLTQLELDIHDEHCTNSIYTERQFSKASRLGVDAVTTFLAFTGITTTKAEQWWPWATAYLEMELEEHPGSNHAPMLKQARGMACNRITKDPKWVFTSVHATAPRNYRLEQAHILCGFCNKARQNKAGLLTNTEASTSSAGRSSSSLRSTHPPDTPEEEVRLTYDSELDKDT